jgi:hypothetical protein
VFRNIKTVCSILGIAIVVVIAGFFLLNIERVALNIWALCSLTLSLVVNMLANLTIVTRKYGKDSVYYNAGLAGALWVYQIAIIISVAFTRLFAEHTTRFVFVELLIHALFLIAAIAIGAGAAHVHNRNLETAEKQESGEYNTPKRGGF